MFSVSLSEVTTTHAAGRSQSTASVTRPAVRATPSMSSRRTLAARSCDQRAVSTLAIRSVLRVPAQQPELQHGEGEDHREEHPRHGGGGAELEEILESGLVEVLDHGPGGVPRSAHREHEDLPEELEGPDDVSHEDEEQHRPQERERDRPEAPRGAGAVEGGRFVELTRNVLKPGQVDHQVV